MKKRLLSVSLALAMLLTLLPLGTMAADDGAPHTHEVDGETVTFDHAITDKSLETGAFKLLVDDRELEVKDTMTLPAGSYRLNGPVGMDGHGLAFERGRVDLCLNDSVLTMDSSLVVNSGDKLTVSDCGGLGSIDRRDTVIEVASATGSSGDHGELVVESGRIDHTGNSGGAIQSEGYVTLRGGEVKGPHGVYLNRTADTYTKPMLTLTGAPKLTGTYYGVSICVRSASSRTPIIDATAYTGEALTIYLEVDPEYTGIDQVLGKPIVKLGGSTPAGKFRLDTRGYRLKKQTVDGVACLVLAPAPATQVKWGADADHLRENGSLADALTFAAEDSKISYIQLVSDVTAAFEETFTATGGTFTLDLNGHTLTGGKGGDMNFTAPGNPALTVDGAEVTVTGTGTLQGGQGGTYSDRIDMNRGGPGARVDSGKLTVDSDGVAVTIGLPGNTCTADDFATGDCALEIWGGETILKAGTVDASEKKNADDEVIQRGGDAIVVQQSGHLTVPKGSTLRATAVGGESGLSITGKAAAKLADIAGGTFGGVHLADWETLPQYGINVSQGTCSISGGSFAGTENGLRWSGSDQVTLSGGYYYGAQDQAVNVSGVTYASLLEEGCSFSLPAPDNTILTDEDVIARTAYLTVTPPPHVHAVSVDCETTGEGLVTFTAWDKTDSLPTAAGNYYLTTDVALTGDWTTPEGTIDLCLNGHTITAPGVAIVSSKETTLNLCDCAETGTISSSGNLSVITLLGTMHLHGGTVSGARVGVLVSKNSEFQMHSGSIKNNLNGIGEGVDVGNGGAFLMDGGVITGNKAGVYVGAGAKFQVKGDVVIKDNTLGNVVLDGEGSHMELSGPLGLGAKIGLSVEDWTAVTADSPKLAVQGAEGYPTVNAVNYAKLFCDNDQYKLTLKDDGKVYFAPAPSFSVRYENGNAIVDAPTAGDYTLVFAAYDADGRLTDLYIAPVSNAPAGKTTFIPNNFTPDATVKVMLLDGLATARPLCPAATWTK